MYIITLIFCYLIFIFASCIYIASKALCSLIFRDYTPYKNKCLLVSPLRFFNFKYAVIFPFASILFGLPPVGRFFHPAADPLKLEKSMLYRWIYPISGTLGIFFFLLALKLLGIRDMIASGILLHLYGFMFLTIITTALHQFLFIYDTELEIVGKFKSGHGKIQHFLAKKMIPLYILNIIILLLLREPIARLISNIYFFVV